MEKIAIVDDDTSFREVLVQYLQGRGYSVFGYATLSQAEKSLNSTFQLVLLDVQIPDGNGIHFLNKLRSIAPNIRKIIMTGYDDLPKRLKSFAFGADDYIKKPLYPAEVAARIKHLLEMPVHSKGQHENPLLRDLSKAEAQVMSLLLQSQGGVVSKEALNQLGFTNNALYVLMTRVKKKIPQEYRIKSSYGRGYYIKKIVL